ncbi:MAG: discoidin domain-containing protein, partial [Planctomycetales bacterium]|nr:discoidin domain-containing protein [Planctomycetales bacterium]
ESAGARSFSTTIGHNTETVRDPRYLDLITRGLLWACDKLNDDYLRPYDGDQQVTFIDKREVTSTNQQSIGKRPAGSTLVYAEASSTQQGHPAQHAIDGDRETRWCADGPQYPASLTLQFEQPLKIEAITLLWESRRAYQYQVEGSTDGQTWQLLLDRSDAGEVIAGEQALPTAATVSHLRITGKSGPRGGWCSIREVSLKGPGLDKLWPAGRDAQTGKLTAAAGNAYEKRGNVPPHIEPLAPEQEAKILREVRIPDGFVATVFAAPPAVNYPVFVAATVDGTLFVSSDGNGSLGRQEERGRVIRLRDLDGDGRADETKVFCEVDAPRGLVWDHDRLYLMHPPHLSVFIDRDGDGVADMQKTLVKNLAFGYDKRPADHTTNGLSLGVDGWLYIAGGDFGFMNAEGADGTMLTHRGGGVIRVRPDGSGLEIYSTGTRNILEVAISPQMEMFARDNTNDGGGWDVRLHHFTGNDNHGYPRLYKNFNDECVQPLADYGGGSGCGAVFIDEPGMGDWNNAPFTADWGTGSLYRHTVSPRGATYAETEPPQPFISLPRPTDADVDGNSRVYCASWLGATFNWAGPDVGYIVCVKPKDFTPAAMPDFAQATDDQLAQVFNDPSYRRRLEAQRELMRRGSPLQQKLLDNGLAQRNAERQLLARLQDDTDPAATELCLNSLNHADPVIVHTAIRMLAKRQAVPECFAAFDAHAAPARPLMRALAQIHQAEVVNGLIARLSDTEGDNRQEVLAALCRLHYQEAAWKGDSWGTRPDTRGPYYEPVAWDETPRIAAALNAALDRSSPAEVSFLIDT